MYNHKQCPECDSTATEVMDTQPNATTIERVRICQDCPTEYVVSYGMPEVVDVTHQA